MNLKDPESMSRIIGNILRFGVLLSAGIIIVGTLILVVEDGYTGVASAFTYNASVPHDGIRLSITGLLSGIWALQPLPIIELGVLVLLATPVSRVMASVFLFAAEGDRLYVYITGIVLTILLFSMLVTPFIPGFNA
jgi:uncharacterized membrane protein